MEEKDKIEITVYKVEGVAPGDMRGSSFFLNLRSQNPEILSFLQSKYSVAFYNR